jgi:hypothetical protein
MRTTDRNGCYYCSEEQCPHDLVSGNAATAEDPAWACEEVDAPDRSDRGYSTYGNISGL